MPYPERIRKWWLRVAGNGDEANARCQVETYTERKGFVECGTARNLQVHHIRPESVAKTHGENPDEVTGLVACDTHHVGKRRDEDNLPFTGGFTFHPDMGEARDKYRAGNKKAFTEASQGHREAAVRGLRFWGGDEGSDEHYERRQSERAARYTREHPTDPKPRVTHREKPEKKKRWFDDLF